MTKNYPQYPLLDYTLEILAEEECSMSNVDWGALDGIIGQIEGDETWTYRMVIALMNSYPSLH